MSYCSVGHLTIIKDDLTRTDDANYIVTEVNLNNATVTPITCECQDFTKTSTKAIKCRYPLDSLKR